MDGNCKAGLNSSVNVNVVDRVVFRFHKVIVYHVVKLLSKDWAQLNSRQQCRACLLNFLSDPFLLHFAVRHVQQTPFSHNPQDMLFAFHLPLLLWRAASSSLSVGRPLEWQQFFDIPSLLCLCLSSLFQGKLLGMGASGAAKGRTQPETRDRATGFSIGWKSKSSCKALSCLDIHTWYACTGNL